MSFAVSSLLIPIQLCGGKKTKSPKYINVFRRFLSFSLTSDAIPCYCDYKIRKFLRHHLFVRFIEIPNKKMKKSVAPLILNGSAQSVRKCILPVFLRLFGNLKRGVTEKIFLIFYRKIYCKLPNLCNRPKTGLLNIPLKTVSYQLLYFTFDFKI